MATDRYVRLYNLSGDILPANREALATARPWAWHRILDGLPAAPHPEAVNRPGRPFTLRLCVAGDATYLHSRIDPVGEAADLVARSRLERRQAVVVLGFGAGYVVEEALAAAPTGCTVTAAVVDPGSFLTTLAHREIPGLLADPRLTLVVGDLGEISAALPLRRENPLWLIHDPVLAAVSPELARLVERPGADGPGGAHDIEVKIGNAGATRRRPATEEDES